ncbi:MAG: Catechol-2,3-dioxygenase [Anaerolineae bacterium]|nr:Catechol-2,3-dioxygenase [Anaerolineae bacterium]
MAIHPETKLGHVHLTVANMARSLEFYRQSLGMQVHWQNNESAGLGAGRRDILRLTENPQARRVPRTTGLYHFAVLTPSRPELARSLWRLAKTQTPLQGFADHGVSEAIYLADPDGNGIEIYRDRPRAEWPFVNGQLQMVTDPLDTDAILAELDGPPDESVGLHPDTVLGHMHVHVSSLLPAEEFYQNVIGFELMQHFGGQAAFLSAGGYHHHLGINTWAGVGAPPPPADAVGLRYFVVELPDEAELNRLVERARRANWPFEEQADGIFGRDPSQNGILITAGQ